jgi:hypothetical protein
MTGNNRLAIISTITWIGILGMLLIGRYPVGDRIAQSVEATMQARPTNSSVTQETLIVEKSPVETESAVVLEPVSVTTQVPTIPCLYAKMVMETIPDGTQISAGGSFTKIWVLENTGSCSWSPGFRLVFTGGEQMNGPSAVRIGKTIAPNERVTVSVDLSAPAYTGSCRGNWTLESERGVRFAPIWLQIDVIS